MRKRLARALRALAEELDPTPKPKRGRPRKACKHEHVNPNTGFDGCSRMCVDCGKDLPTLFDETRALHEVEDAQCAIRVRVEEQA